MRSRAGLVVALLAGAVGVAMGPPPAAAAGSYTWAPAGTFGGGFINVIEPSPITPGLWLAGSDAAGVFHSTDGGLTWRPAEHGFESTDASAVASVAFDRLTPGRAYACGGQAHKDGKAYGAFERSDDGGRSFVVTSAAVACVGLLTRNSGLPQPHPRSTGRLIVPDPVTPDKVWLATYRNGVAVSTNAGTTWTSKGLSGSFIRALIVDPTNPNVLFAAVRTPSGTGGGVYRTTNANAATPTWQKLAGVQLAEELAIAGRTLYVAAGNKGLYRADLSAPTPTLTAVASLKPLLATNTDLYDIVATRAGTSDVITVGLDQDAKCTIGFCPTVLRSTNGGGSWNALPSSPAGSHPTVGGPGGPRWRQAAHPNSLLGGSEHAAASVRYDPFTPGTMLVSGRSGVWRSSDDGEDWYPSVEGLAVTFHSAVATDPVVAGRVLAGVADWDLMTSDDGGRTVVDVDLPGEATSVAALSGWTGPGAAPMYVGVSAGKGDVLVQETPGGPFTSLGLANASGASNVTAVGARTVGASRVVLAVTVGKGLWRKQGSAAWVRVASSPGGANGAVAPRLSEVRWAPDGGAVFVADQGKEPGVWRSLDAGLTWQKVATGVLDIAVDPTAPARLWLAGSGAIQRVDGARVGNVASGGLTVDDSTPFTRARLIDVGPSGDVVAVSEDDSTIQPGVTVARSAAMRSTDAGATWDDVGDTTFSAGVVEPTALAVGVDGTIEIVTYSSGWWVGTSS